MVTERKQGHGNTVHGEPATRGLGMEFGIDLSRMVIVLSFEGLEGPTGGILLSSFFEYNDLGCISSAFSVIILTHFAL